MRKVPKTLLPKDKKVYIGVSGGPDSMALLNFLHLHGKRECVVLHFNHRTEFGEMAAVFVEDYCNKNNIEFKSAAFDSRIKPSEVTWRDARYDFFEKSTQPGDSIFLGHNLDDSRENYLMTFFSSRVPSVILPKVQKQKRFFVRPLSFIKREEIYSYLLKNKIPWLEDPSNETNTCTRTKMRNTILPLVDQLIPGDGGYSICKKMLFDSLE